MNSFNRPFVDLLEPRQFLSATLTPGVSYDTGLKTAGAQKNWSFNLVAGQAIMASVGNVSTDAPNFHPELILIAPNGKAIARSSGNIGALVSKSAPVTGTYRVRVRDTDDVATASIAITAFYTNGTTITDGDDGGTANSGERFPATISPGDLDVWQIPATAGQFLSVVANENDIGSGVGVGVLVVGPNGQGVISGASDTGLSLDVPKIQSGEYYAVVYDFGLTTTGRYGISFGQTPGPQTTEDPDTQTPLSSGVARNGNLPSGDIDLFQVPVTAGHTISVTASRTGGTTTPQILLIDPNGNEVAHSGTGATNTSVSTNTTVGGTWSILLRNAEPDDGGAYALTYTLS